jgi:hypothetical protein
VNTKNRLDRIFHQINVSSSCCYLSKSFVAEKKHGLCKVIHKEKEKKKERIGKKWTSVQDI